MSDTRPTVAALKAALAQLPDDAVWWAYEGEVSGIIIDHPDVSAVLHNDGDVDVTRKREKARVSPPASVPAEEPPTGGLRARCPRCRRAHSVVWIPHHGYACEVCDPSKFGPSA